MDSFVFDLQLFAVDYANPAKNGSDLEHGKHAIALNVGQYYAIADEEAIDAIDNTSKTVQMQTATAVYAAALSEDPPSDGTYFFGVDGYLYAQSANADSDTKTARDNKMASLLRNERGRDGYPGIKADAEKFFMGTVTIKNAAVTSVTCFGGDNMWYGESVEILEDASYTVEKDGYIYSIGASDEKMEGAVFFELPTSTGSYGEDGAYEFSVNDKGEVAFTKEPEGGFVRLLSGDLTVNLKDAAAPRNIVFMNGNDDAYNDQKRDRGHSYIGDWAARKDRATDIAAVGMNNKLSTSVKFTGIETDKEGIETATVTVNNRSYTVSEGLTFIRDYTDDGVDEDHRNSTSRIKEIKGTGAIEKLTIGDSTSIKADPENDIAILGNTEDGGKAINLDAGADELTFNNTAKITIKGVVDLGDDNDTLSFATGSKQVVVEGGITGGAGSDTYNLTNASNDTTITINDYGAGDKLIFSGSQSVLTVGEKETATYVVTAIKGTSENIVTVKTASDDATPTKFAFGTNSIVVTGDEVAVYDTSGLNDVTVVPPTASAKSKVTYMGKEKTETLAPKEITLTLDAANATVAADPVKYALLTDGTVVKTGEKLTIGTTKLKADNGTQAADGLVVIGYFNATTAWNDGSPKVSISFVGGEKTVEGKKVATVTSYLGKVAINAEAVATIKSSGDAQAPSQPLSVLAVDDVSGTEKGVSVTQLYKDANTEGVDGTIAYLETYVLGTTNSANSINLASLVGTTTSPVANGTYYFAVTDTGSATANKGVHTYSISQTGLVESAWQAQEGYAKISAFKVEKAENNYTITFAGGTDGKPTNLTVDCWAGIQIDATGADKAIKIAAATADTEAGYTVNNIPVGISVTETGEGSPTVVRNFASYTYTLTGGTITLEDADADDAVTRYFTVSSNKGEVTDGRVTITIAESFEDDGSTPKQPTSGSYLTVSTSKATSGNVLGEVTISYTDGAGIPLAGLKDSDGNDVKLTINADDLNKDNVSTLTFDALMKGNVAATVTNLKSGIAVSDTGAVATLDTETCPTGYLNKVAFDLTGLTDETPKVVYIAAGTRDADTRYSEIAVSETTTANYYTVTQTTDEETGKKTVKVVYTGSLNLSTAEGKTQISAANDALITDVTIGANETLTNATAKIEKLTYGDPATVVTSDFSGAETAEAISFVATAEFDGEIDVSGIASSLFPDVESSKVLYFTVKPAAAKKGITVYEIAAVSGSTPPDKDNDNFFTAKYKDNTITLTYTPKSSGGVSAADLGKVGVIAFAGNTVPDGTTKLVLTKESDTADAIAYKVTKLPASVTTIENGTGTGDVIEYADTYKLADGASIKLGSVTATTYYEVVVDSTVEAKYGVHTVKLQALTFDAKLSEAELEAEKKRHNYFTVKTDGSMGTTSIIYTPVQSTEKMADGTTPKYTAIALTGTSTLNVDPTGAAKDAVITVGGVENKYTDNSDNVVYKVTGLSYTSSTEKQTVAPYSGKTAATSLDGSTYQTSYAITYNGSAYDGTNGINLTSDAGTKYYIVTKTAADTDAVTPTNYGVCTYDVTAADSSTISAIEKGTYSGNYIAITNSATGFGVTVKYSGEDLSALTAAGKKFAINAAGAASTVSDIDLANTSGTIAYALTNVGAGVTVKNAGANDEYAAQTAITLSDTLALGGETALVTYYIVGSDGKLTAAAAKPGTDSNYLSVTKNDDGTSYTVAYQKATTGTAYSLKKPDSELKVNAASIGGTASNVSIVFSNGIKNTVTGAKGNVTPSKPVGDTATSFTISYTTKFAWAAGTYFVPTKEADGTTAVTTLDLASATTVTTDPTDSTTVYNKVLVSVAKDGTYSVTISGLKGDGSTGKIDQGDTATITTIDVTPATSAAAITKFNATGLASGTEVKGFATGAYVTNVANGVKVTGAGTLKVNYGADTENDKTFKASTGNITVASTGSAFKGVDGVFLIDKTNGKFEGNGAATANKYIDVEVTSAAADGTDTTDHKVAVTFEGGFITSITGLDVGEEVKVTQYDKTDPTKKVNYLYTIDAEGTVTRKNTATGDKEIAGGDGAGVNIVGLDYVAEKDVVVAMADKTFDWTQRGTAQYFTIGSDGTVAIPSDGYTAEGKQVAKDTNYVRLTVSNATPAVVEMDVVKGSSLGTVSANPDFAGTISITAPSSAISYTKTAANKFAVKLTNVAAGSVISGMDLGTALIDDVTGDTITTAALAAGKSVTVDSKVYTSAVAGTVLSFTDGELTSTGEGGLTVTSAIALANGSTVASTGAAVKVVVATTNGVTSISELSGLASGETATVTEKDADGNTVKTTVYTGTTDAKKVDVTVTTEATGDVSKYTLTLTADNGNVIGITPALNGYTNKFAWQSATPGWTGGTGYFAVGMDSKQASTYNKAEVKADTVSADTFKENTVYIEAATTKDGTNPVVLTLTAKKFDGTQLTTEGVDTGLYTITVHADQSGDGTGTANKIAYNGTGSNFKLVVDGVAKDSVFTNVYKGSTITTASLTASTDSVVINGKTYTAAETGAFKFYTTSRSAANLVTGTVMVTDELTASTADATSASTLKQVTLAYTAGTADGSKDGMKVKYDTGVLQYIKGAGVGEKLTITDANGKVTTYEVLTDGTTPVAFMQDSEGTVTYVTVSNADTNIAGTKTGDFTTPTTTKFAWSDATASPAKDAAGVFLIADNAVTVGNQSAATAITYKNYGAAYVYATYKADGTLALSKGTVPAAGGTLTGGGAFANTDAVTVSAEGKTINYATRDAMKSLYLENVGDGSVIATTGWTDSDKVTTAALPTAGTSKVTVGGKVFTAGTANTKLTIAGLANAYTTSAGTTVIDTTKNNGPVLTAGAVLLSGTTGATTELWARNVSNDKTVTEQHVTYNYNTWSTAASQNLVVTVLGGEVSSITGLDAEAGHAEKFTIDTYTTTSTGKTTLSTAEYTAEYVESGAKKGQILVTKVEDGVTSTHYFASNALNIVDKTITWTPTNQETARTFDWEKKGYFVATAASATPTVYNVDGTNSSDSQIADQTSSSLDPIVKGDKKTYLEVTATKDTAGVATISNMRLVKVNADGTFADVATTNTIGTVKIDASATKGIKFEANEATKLVITGAVAGSVFTGLNAEDTVTGTFTGAGVVTVGETKYNVATTDAFTITGENTITKGVFTITDTKNPVKSSVTATAITGPLDTSLQYSSTEATATGVEVTFGATGITSVKNMHAGETVVVTATDGGTRTFAAAADSTNSANTIITQTIDFAETTAPANLVLKSGSAVSGTVAGYNALSMSYYQAANKFDFGATETTGQMGIFKVASNTTTIATQDDASLTANAFGSSDASFVLVGATKGSGGYTINHLEVLAYDYTDANNSTLKRKNASDATVGNKVTSISITAPTDGGITLGEDAVKLYTAYTTDPKTGEIIVNETATETKRTYGIAVKAAQAGMTYSNFNELDTIATSGTLAEGKSLTVGGVTYTAAESRAVVIRGDGKAVDGVFAIGNGLSGASSTDVVTVTSTGATGATDAIVTFEDGKVTAINGLKTAGQQVTLTQTDIATGAITTTAYKVTAVTADGLTVERAITKDGITTTTTSKTPIALIDSVTDGTYTGATATLSSKFDWTAAGGAGYFLTEITDTVKELGTNLTVEAQTSEVKGEAGKYYLKVALSADGVVSGVTLHKVNADGSLADNSLGSVTAGTINIVAPSTKANIDISNFTGLQSAVKVSITGAAAESTVANMRAGDLFMTTTLAAGKTVKVGKTGDASPTEYTVGADGFLKFQNAAQLVEGTVQFTADTASDVMTGDVAKFSVDVDTNDSATITDDKVLVKVLNGAVTSISGLTSVKTSAAGVTPEVYASVGAVTVTDKNGNVATYKASADKAGIMGVDLKTPLVADKEIETIALAQGAAIAVNGTAQAYTVGAAGTVKFYASDASTVQAVAGTLQFSANGSVATKAQGAVTVAGLGASSDVDVVIKDGAVISVMGLKANESVTIASVDVPKADGSGTEKKQVKYTAKSATVIEKTVGTGDTAVTTTAYLTTAGGDVISAKYQAVDSSTDISDESNLIEGQLSWADVSGRSTGYFKVTNDKAAIAEQAAKVTVTAPKNTATKDNSVIYAVANAATDEDNNKRQTLTIGALKATTDTAGKTTITGNDAKTLLSGATLTVTAPTTKVTLADGSEVVPALVYEKASTDTFHIVLNKVAKDSAITGLAAGDKMTTASLAAPVWNTTTYQTDYESVTLTDSAGNAAVYAAGAKGTLEFLGETTSTTVGEVTTKTNVATLLNGTVVLNNTYQSATLSGSKTASESGAGDDITVSVSAVDPSDESAATVYNDVAVTVKNGQVTGITGLYQAGAIVTVAPTGGTQVTYRVLQSTPVWNAAGTAITRYDTLISRTEGTGDSAITYFGSFTSLKNVYATSSVGSKGYTVTNGYKPVGADTPTNVDVIWSATTSTPVYVTAYTGIFQKGEKASIKAATEPRGNLYDVMTVKTGTNGITTISKIERMAVNAQGVPAAVKTTVASATIDGTITAASGGTPGTYAKISYKVPTTMTLTATNVGLGSVFTGLGDDDLVTTATDSGTFTFGTKNDGTSVTVYKANAGFGTETTVYTSKTAGVKATMADGKLTISNFTSGSLSVVSTTKAGGKVTTDYAYDSKGVLTKTVTDVNGAKEVYALDTTDAGVADDLTGFKFAANPTINQVVSEFDWTLAKNKTGYFAIANGKATAKATPKTTIKNAASNYLAVTLSDNGVISDVSQMVFDATAYTTHGMKEVTDPTFSGTIAITAPAKLALTFDRSKLNANSIDATAKVAVTGAVGGLAYYDGAEWVQNGASKITSLKEGDTVTTAKMAYNAKTYAGQHQMVLLSVDGGDVAAFTAGAASALSFAVANVDEATHLTLTSGTIAMSSTGTETEGDGFAYVGTKLVTMKAKAGGGASSLTVTASKNGASYTIGDLGEGESFSVEDFSAGTVKTYTKSSTTLFCETVSGDGTTMSVYTLGTKTSVASSVLDSTNGWTFYGESNATFTDTESGLALVSGNAVTIDLATLDKRIATDLGKNAAGGYAGSYQFVIDKYMAAPAKFKGAASVISAANYTNFQQIIGSVTGNYVYKADVDGTDTTTGSTIGQTIKATSGWTVNGSDAADVITGATKGTDTLIGGKGDDTLTGGNANDTFVFNLTDSGKDTVTKYTTGKDAIVIGDGTEALALESIALVAGKSGRNAADVLLHDGTYDAETNTEAKNSVLLAAMGSGKAVTINGQSYYFGNAAKASAMTFAYTEGAYYLANAAANTAKASNTINVTTDKTKATAKTLGDAVTVDLSDTAHYANIKAVSAKSSGNRVILKASDTGSSLVGGTYQSTLMGGAGNDSMAGGSGSDTFWFETVEGTDTVTSYVSGKDAVYFGDVTGETTATSLNGYTVSAVGSDVQISNGDTGAVTLKNAVNAAKAITVVSDKDAGTTLSYYVGKVGTAKKAATNTYTVTLGKDTKASVGSAEVNAGTFTSYYVGNDAATDTLKLAGADKRTAVGTASNMATFDMTSGNLSSIDAIDASGLAANSYVKLIGKASGTYSLIGSTKAAKESFDLSKVTSVDNQATVTVKGLDLADVIELGSGVTATLNTSKTKGNNTYFTLSTTEGTVGEVLVSGVKSSTFAKTTYTGQIKRNS